MMYDGIEYYKGFNAEALETVEGGRVVRPAYIIEQDLKMKEEKFGKLHS